MIEISVPNMVAFSIKHVISVLLDLVVSLKLGDSLSKCCDQTGKTSLQCSAQEGC